jgi:hypothetical protein
MTQEFPQKIMDRRVTVERGMVALFDDTEDGLESEKRQVEENSV